MGSTSVVAIVSPKRIVVANTGDSRAVLSTGGKAVPLCTDYKVRRLARLGRLEAGEMGDCSVDLVHDAYAKDWNSALLSNIKLIFGVYDGHGGCQVLAVLFVLSVFSVLSVLSVLSVPSVFKSLSILILHQLYVMSFLYFPLYLHHVFLHHHIDHQHETHHAQLIMLSIMSTQMWHDPYILSPRTISQLIHVQTRHTSSPCTSHILTPPLYLPLLPGGKLLLHSHARSGDRGTPPKV